MTWRTVAIAASLAFLAGLLLARATARPPPPKVQWLEHTKYVVDERKVIDRQVEKGPVRVVDRWFAPAPPASCPSASPQVLRERVVERGPEKAATRTETARAAAQERQAELVVTPAAPRPGWALSAGVQLAGGRAAQLELERRLFGPLWIKGWVQGQLELRPPALGVGLRLEF